MKAAALYTTLWILLSMVVALDRMLLPDAPATIAAAWRLSVSGNLLNDLAITLARTFVGVAFALTIGLAVGLGLAGQRWFHDYVEPALDFVRSIPVAMLFPLFIVLAGIGELSRFLMVLTLATPILIVNVAAGMNRVREMIDQRAWFALHANQLPRFLTIASIAWSLMPGILGGVKAAVSLGLVMVVVSEMLFVASSGIGYAAFQAYNAFKMQDMYAYVLVAGLTGTVMNRGIDAMARRLVDRRPAP